MQWLKQSTAVTLKIGPFLDSSDGNTAETGLTIAQADVRLSKNGGNMAQKNEATSCTHDELGIYGCPIDATDTGTLGRLQLWVHESGALQVWHEYMVLPANVYDSLVGGSDALQVHANEITAGLITSVAIATDAIDADALAADALAEINAEVDTALADVHLDHLVGTASGIPAITAGTYIDQIMDDGTASFDRTTDSLQAIRDRGDAAWTTGGGGSISDILNVQPLIPESIDLANTATWRLGLMLINSLDDLPTTAEITPGTIDIDRKAIGGTSWSSVVSGAACSEAAGLIYYDEVFDSGTGYAEGDSIRVTFKSQLITVAANNYEISDATGRLFYTEIRQTERGTDSAALASVCTEGRLGELDAANVPADLDAVLADTGELQTDWVNGGRLDLLIDAILADTGELQTDWVNGGRLDLLIDAILADTGELQTDWVNGGRLDLLIDAILADTGTDGVVLADGAITAAKIAADAITSSELATSAAQEIADEILKRGVANVEASADADSLAALILGAFHAAIVSTTLTVYRTDDSTAFDTYTVTTDSGADPITAVADPA